MRLPEAQEERVNQLLGGQVAAQRSGEQAVGFRGVRRCHQGLALIGLRGEDEAREILQIVIVRHQLARQIVQQFGMGWLGVRPVIGGFHNAESHVALPHAIDDHLREAAVLGGDNERRQRVTAGLGTGAGQ